MGVRRMFRGPKSGRVPGALIAMALATVAACGSGTASPEVGVPTSSMSTASASAGTGSAAAAPPTEVVAPPLSGTDGAAQQPAGTSATSETSDGPTATAIPESSLAPEPSAAPPSVRTSVDPVSSSPSVRGDVAGRVVVLDPGHNGANGANLSIINAPVDAGFGETKACNTTGTSTDDGYPEHRFTWSVANRVEALLVASGVTVVMTRESDDGVGPCVNERARIGNEAGADAVVSIHGDGSAVGDRGFYAMTSERLPHGREVGDASLALAAAVRDGLVAAGAEPSNYLGSDGLWKRDDLAGLNLSRVPTTMLELGNMRDPQDAAFMASDAGQDLLAAGIAQGILDHLAAG
jgi:N-acetylmuramoyl-L-alanine amidase